MAELSAWAAAAPDACAAWVCSSGIGHGFGASPPIEAWESDDKIACGIVTRSDLDESFGCIVMRRRIDHVWMVIDEKKFIPTLDAARQLIEPLMKEGSGHEALPPGEVMRPFLHDMGTRESSQIFKFLAQPTHKAAAWTFNQLYLALPRPDRNWASDCQTGNFHTRMWEAQLLASLREQGILVTQPCEAPDFRIENRAGEEAWIEAVTTSPPVVYNHVGTPLTPMPKKKSEIFFGRAVLRYAKTIGN